MMPSVTSSPLSSIKCGSTATADFDEINPPAVRPDLQCLPFRREPPPLPVRRSTTSYLTRNVSDSARRPRRPPVKPRRPPAATGSQNQVNQPPAPPIGRAATSPPLFQTISDLESAPKRYGARNLGQDGRNLGEAHLHDIGLGAGVWALVKEVGGGTSRGSCHSAEAPIEAEVAVWVLYVPR